MAAELDSVADAIARESSAVVPAINQTLMSYEPQYRPIEDDPDRSPSDLSVAIPDGRVDVTYNCNLKPDSRINLPASIHMARRDAQEGKVVKLDFGPDKDPIFLTKENWNQVVT